MTAHHVDSGRPRRGRGSAGRRAGGRPDCAGPAEPVAAYPLRLLDILRGRTAHVVLADTAAQLSDYLTELSPPT
ncbi:hypothetical protein ACWGDS_11640 [Streptomyces sp. NPDC055059]|uniref:Uncharacterized protein n=1 Tax=Streptomyces sp. NBC_00119 TaxID=2975659 RepID=A0AAU1U2R6_9ACTN|nr:MULTISPECIES: hypothetical protein [unclassified Streptomyces]MCX4640959.1 hypothetical protein [Streptomyces sp. NBC_01446]MCX5322622.1 hypothetical protein [Streptomyces sp. NBC_00120]